MKKGLRRSFPVPFRQPLIEEITDLMKKGLRLTNHDTLIGFWTMMRE